MEIAFFFLLTNHADSELNNYDSYDLLTQRIVSKSFSPGSGAVPRVRPLNLLLAEQDPFSAISSSPLSFIIMHSTLCCNYQTVVYPIPRLPLSKYAIP